MQTEKWTGSWFPKSLNRCKKGMNRCMRNLGIPDSILYWYIIKLHQYKMFEKLEPVHGTAWIGAKALVKKIERILYWYITYLNQYKSFLRILNWCILSDEPVQKYLIYCFCFLFCFNKLVHVFSMNRCIALFRSK
jgi:hypothetical protein